MSAVQAKELAHELTIEYIRQHNEIMSMGISNVQEIVNKIAEINRKFYENIIHNSKFDGLY